MQLSYWELKNWFTRWITPVGSGIVGLHAALLAKNTESKILVLEKECYHGASTKNAGFACFGISEIIDDLKSHSEEVYQLVVTKRLEGLRLLRKPGDEAIDFKLMEVMNCFKRR
jgi:glycine/D-amino acid oxidase-like deaminating enzyme